MNNMTSNCTKGEGVITTKTLSIATFNGVDLGFASNVTINQGPSQKVEATGHPNIIDLVTTSVSNGIWFIGLSGTCQKEYELSIEITVPDISQLTLSGSGDLVANNFSNQSGLNVNLKGSGDITLNEFEGITNLDINLGGSGNLLGNNDILSLTTLNLINSGSGNYSGFKISSDDCTVNLSGSGNCELTARNTLNATIGGSGNIHYKGMPTITQNISGSGVLTDAN